VVGRWLRRRTLPPLLLAGVVGVPAAAQEMEAVGDGFLYQARTEALPEGLLLSSLGDRERGMLLVWSCPRGQPGIALIPRQGVPEGEVRVSWRLDNDGLQAGEARQPATQRGALVFPLARTMELTRGAATSSWLVVRLATDAGEQAWAYSLDEAEQAFSRLSCVRAARDADASSWAPRPRIPITPEVQQVQGDPPPQAGPGREAAAAGLDEGDASADGATRRPPSAGSSA
jgi:hypothetical protein